MNRVTLKTPADLDALLAAAAGGDGAPPAAAVAAVRLGENFNVRDTHIERLVGALGPQLRAIHLGSSDTGDGAWVTDAGVAAIVGGGCENLRELRLEACVQVTDKAFAAIVAGLPQLEVLSITGHDKRIGAPACMAGRTQRSLGAAARPTHGGTCCRDDLISTLYPVCLAGNITKKAIAPLVKDKGALPQASAAQAVGAAGPRSPAARAAPA